MNTITRSTFAVVALAAFLPSLSTSVCAQGSLTPPAGVPTPSMKTLDQVEARTPLVAGAAGVTVDAAGTITITQPGSYYLTKNITITTNVDGLVINADATVDLNGFGIIGTAAAITTGDAISINTSANATVRNGFVKGGTTVSGITATPSGFDRGISALAPAAGVRSAVNLSDLTITGMRTDGIYLRRQSRVERCTVQAVGDSGIDAYQFILNLSANDQRLMSVVSHCHASDCAGNFGISGDTVGHCFGHCGKLVVSDSDLAYGVFGRVVEHSIGWNDSVGPGSNKAGIFAIVASYCTGRGSVAINAETAVACRTEGGPIVSPRSTSARRDAAFHLLCSNQAHHTMNTRFILSLALSTLFLQLSTPAHAQSNVSATNRYAYGANTGWLDARAGDGTYGLKAGPCVLKGFLYSANCGWINVGSGQPQDGQQYSNASGADSGVNRLPDGKLRGLAWGAAIGWINFEATGNPRIDPLSGVVAGYAWSAGTGWISFDTPQTDLLLVSGDTDRDGIPDAWELLHAANLTILGVGTDNDGDGQNDVAEYAADTDPRDAASVLRITYLAMRPDLGAGTLRWTSTPTRNYRVQTSPDLINWSFLTVPPLYYGDDFGFNSSSVPYSGPKHFFRVIALKPPAGE